ncbi:MAG TPA: M48 family metallopeptidase [Rhizomicrobium sp.]|jgi:STE24 endopeptidase
MFKTLMRAILIVLASFALCTLAYAQQLGAPPHAAPTTGVEVHQLPSMEKKPIHFDAEKATTAYLARIKGPERTRSNSYFEGGYLLLVVDALYALVVMGILLWLRISAWMRNFAQNRTRSRFWQVPIYFIMFFVVATAATFPLTLYEGFFREHAYGLSNQNFVQWFGDFAIEFATTLIILTLMITLLYAGIRAARRGWWLWGAALTMFFMAAVTLIYPVYLAPLFNHYQPLPDGPVKQQILSLARANGVPATNVYEFDASRQSNRISANVSGLFGTTQISVTDNLLTRGTPSEAKAILGHEVGHYVMNHVLVNLLWFAIVFVIGFWFADRIFRLLTGLFGGNWDVRTVEDPAGLPALYAAFTIYMFFATPFVNTIIRTQEAQADIFGVNAAREPDAFATSVLKLSEYRKLEPSPLEEWVFFDHPSGRSRISMMMRWKAEHINDPDIKAGPVSPQ